jgi:hypothetical protein
MPIWSRRRRRTMSEFDVRQIGSLDGLIPFNPVYLVQ